MIEDLANVRTDEDTVEQEIAGNSVANMVGCECAAVLGLENVFVNPLVVRAFELFVNEPVGRFPDIDSRAPA